MFLPRAGALINLWLTKEINAPLDLYFSFIDKAKIESSQIGQIVNVMREYKAYAVECVITMVTQGEEKKYLKIELKEISGREIPGIEFFIPEEYSRFVLK